MLGGTLKVFAVAVALMTLTGVALADTVQWTRQFGSPAFDDASGVAVDATDAYATGGTLDALPGQTSSGGFDAYVRKYDSDGNELWTRQFGTGSNDRAIKVAVDESGVYTVGDTRGTLPGASSVGRSDTFIRKYDTDGNEVWTRQIGTSASDFALNVAVDSSGIYVFGITFGTFPGEPKPGGLDFYLARLDPDGDLIWVREFGTPADDPPVFFIAGGLAVDGGGVFVVSTVAAPLPGETSLGRQDGFVRKYGFDGTALWTRMISTPCDDNAGASAATGGGVFVGGGTLGNLDDPDSPPCSASSAVRGIPPSKSGVGYVRRYDGDGNLAWSRMVRPRSGFALVHAMAASATRLYIGGEAFRGPDVPAPERSDPACARRSWFEDPDAYAAAFDLSGAPQWYTQFGTNGADVPLGIAIGSAGLYLSGTTECALPGQTSAGDFDAFVVRLSP